MRGENDVETMPLISSTHTLPPRLTPLEQRLAFLTDDVVCTLTDDQVLLAEGIIMAYRIMATAGASVEVREDHVVGVGSAMAAPSIMVYASQLDALTKNPHGGRTFGNRYYNTCEMSGALQLLREVDNALAWCEGKKAVTAQLFSPVTASYLQQGGRSPYNDGDARGVSEVSPKAGSNSSYSVDSQEMQHGGVRVRYYEGPDGNIISRSRSRVWVPDTLPSMSTGVACKLDFDRWTARLVSLQAQHDGWRLLLLRCVAEEGVRRHTVIAEERLGRITLLVTAREEVSARVGLQAQRGALDLQREDSACTVGAVQKIMTLLECERQEPFRSANHEIKETQTLVTGFCSADVMWSEFTHALLCESERTQRVGIVQESKLSLQLLLAQWQLVVNHVGSRRLLAAKEGRIRELAANHHGPPTPNNASSLPVYFPPARGPERPRSNSNGSPTLRSGSARCEASTSFVARVPEVTAPAASDIVARRCSGDDATPSPILAAAPQLRTRKSRSGEASDIPLHICISMEGVERKQLALTERRAWQKLVSGLQAE